MWGSGLQVGVRRTRFARESQRGGHEGGAVAGHRQSGPRLRGDQVVLGLRCNDERSDEEFLSLDEERRGGGGFFSAPESREATRNG